MSLDLRSRIPETLLLLANSNGAKPGKSSSKMPSSLYRTETKRNHNRKLTTNHILGLVPPPRTPVACNIKPRRQN